MEKQKTLDLAALRLWSFLQFSGPHQPQKDRDFLRPLCRPQNMARLKMQVKHNLTLALSLHKFYSLLTSNSKNERRPKRSRNALNCIKPTIRFTFLSTTTRPVAPGFPDLSWHPSWQRSMWGECGFSLLDVLLWSSQTVSKGNAWKREHGRTSATCLVAVLRSQLRLWPFQQVLSLFYSLQLPRSFAFQWFFSMLASLSLVLLAHFFRWIVEHGEKR